MRLQILTTDGAMMSWKIRRTKPIRFKNYVLLQGAGIATLDDFDLSTIECDSYWYDGEGAQVWVTDLPKTMFRSLYIDTQSVIESATREHWGIELYAWEQPLRFNQYERGIGFPEHTDYNATDGSKMSLIQLMNEDFHGGALYICDERVDMQAGDVVVMPSFMPNRVEPITAGERITFSAWATGPRYV